MRPRPGRVRGSRHGGREARFRFHCAEGFATQRLARTLHSLVRVSRRVGCSHSDANDLGARCRHTSDRRNRKTVPGHRTRCTEPAGSPTEGTQPTPKGRPAPHVRKTATLSSVASRLPNVRAVRSPRRSAEPPPQTPAEPEATAVGRLPAEVQNRRGSPRRDERSLSASAARRDPAPAPEPDEEPLQPHSFPS